MAGGQIDFSCKDDIFLDGKLPGDVMVSILCNLPVKSLLKFRAVSKSWCSLISSPRFSKLHHHRQSVIANYLLMQLEDDDDSEYSKYGLLPRNHNKNTTADNDVLILENSPLPKGGFSGIIGSCNGLVCVYCYKKGLVLWNPATRKYRSIECPDDLAYYTAGLCYADATNDFKILVWNWYHTNTPHRRHLFVYSMSSDSWKKLDYDAEKYPIINIKPPIFTCGCMHWLANACIVAYDVTDGGAMSGFRLPCRFSKPIQILGSRLPCRFSKPIQILSIRGCLSVVLVHKPQASEEYVFDVWVMEEYGVEVSWVKRFAIRGISPSKPSRSCNDGEFVFICENDNELSRRLTFYDPYSKSEYYLDFMSLHNYKWEVFNYVESLAAVETVEGIALTN